MIFNLVYPNVSNNVKLPSIASMPSKMALFIELPGWAANPAPTAAIAAGPCTMASIPPPCRSIAPPLNALTKFLNFVNCVERPYY